MKKLIIILCLLCIGCTSPKDREEIPKQWGTILWRSSPFKYNITIEIFIVKRKGYLYLIQGNQSPILLPNICEEVK